MDLMQVCNQLRGKIPQYSDFLSGTIVNGVSVNINNGVFDILPNSFVIGQSVTITGADTDVSEVSSEIVNYSHKITESYGKNIGELWITENFTDCRLHKDIRINLIDDIARGIEEFRITHKPRLFIIDNGTTLKNSKGESNTYQSYELDTHFSIFVILPSKGDLFNQKNMVAIKSIESLLIKSLLNYKPITTYSYIEPVNYKGYNINNIDKDYIMFKFDFNSKELVEDVNSDIFGYDVELLDNIFS